MLTLADIKSALNITWDDESEDRKVKGEAMRAQSAVGGLIGKPGAVFFSDDPEAAFDISGEEEQLFLDAVRYIHEDAFEDFRPNFRETIISIRASNIASADSEAAEDA